VRTGNLVFISDDIIVKGGFVPINGAGLLISLRKEKPHMSGTREGAAKAAATNRTRHGKDFYARIGRKGGQNGHTGGFAANRELAREAGSRGGRISRRGPAKNGTRIEVM
jgi:general stress protein YciG